MGIPELLNSYDRVQALYSLAAEAAGKAEWLTVYIAYAELVRIRGSMDDRVRMSEAARLIGLLDFAGMPHEVSIKHVCKTLGPVFGVNLMAKAVVLDQERSLEDNCSLFFGDDTLDPVLLRAVATRALASSEKVPVRFHQLQDEMITDIRLAPRLGSVRVRESYTELFGCFGESQMPASFNRVEILPAEIIALQNTVCCIGSELMVVDGVYCADTVGFGDESRSDHQADSWIVAMSRERVILRSILSETKNIEIKEALWAAYPATEAWGEFFNHVLCRLAVYYEANPYSSISVVLSSDVPPAFVSFAKYVFPSSDFIQIAAGQKVLVNKLWVIPSRHYNPAHEFWSMSGDRFRVFPEKQCLEMLRKAISRVHKAEGTKRRMFLSRKGGRYRRGATEEFLAMLANYNKFESVNMSVLSPPEQINVAGGSTRVFGELGSHWNLFAALGREDLDSLVIYHDRPREWQSVLQILSLQPRKCEIILGSRNIPSIGYGWESYHQSISLGSENLRQIRNWTEKF